MKFISLAILFCYFSTFSVGNTVTIECFYTMKEGYWQINREEYQCYVVNYQDFNGSRVTIDKAVGNHTDGMTDDDVKFFTIQFTNLKYFPRNLENVFKNLELIFIYDSKLVEITSEDLRPFPKLKYFFLEGNPIEVIKEDLFIHNPELEVLYFAYTKISHIDLNALSHLDKLRAFRFHNKVCKFDKNEVETRSEVLKIVEKIEQGQCQSPKYTTTTENPLISLINQINQKIEKEQEENKKFKEDFYARERGNNLLAEKLMLKEEQLKIMNFKLEQCNAKLKEKSTTN
ncbi:hypothetical protein PVAND_009202 [Polypedilum vanderplanki]|uniref:Leucine-rich immune protein (Short) n=1 Tax=Polypedilum vanderplanki TaxID=319348 RepID=A0A9J6CCJ8_POLVA|nr:hypothetical protein PVAND_009202 [Polypedilum vanderplanki]